MAKSGKIKEQAMSPTERRAAYSLASIYSLRMMGLFMILPVFSLYARGLEGVTTVLIGLAIGIYGLTQALLQIPFGMLSDRFGRKPIITIGLLIFALGSIVAASSDSILWIIIGRALQGCGAIAAAVMAMAADLTREEHRTKIMAVIGMSIGLSFAASLVLGPVLNHWIGVPGIFWLTAILAIGGIVVINFVVPQPAHTSFHRDAESVIGFFPAVIRNTQLLRLDIGIFVLHMILTASFVVMPFALHDDAGLDVSHHWYIYLPVFLLALSGMVPLVIIAEKQRRIREVFIAAIAMVAVAELALALFYHSIVGVFLALLLFFLAFNVLEALLPSLVAKFAPADKKGTAMGVYSTSQFLGAFVGGLAGGMIYGSFGISGVFAFCALAAAAWALIARTMSQPRYLSSYLVHVGPQEPSGASALEKRFTAINGVAEAVVVSDEGVAYLKIDSKIVDTSVLDGFSTEDRTAGSSAAVRQDSDDQIDQQNPVLGTRK